MDFKTSFPIYTESQLCTRHTMYLCHAVYSSLTLQLHLRVFGLLQMTNSSQSKGLNCLRRIEQSVRSLSEMALKMLI